MNRCWLLEESKHVRFKNHDNHIVKILQTKRRPRNWVVRFAHNYISLTKSIFGDCDVSQKASSVSLVTSTPLRFHFPTNVDKIILFSF